MKRIGRLLSPILFVCAASSCTPSDHHQKGRASVVVWSGWTGHEGRAFQALVNRFNRSQTRILVQNLGGVQDDTRTIRAIAAGVPPDLFFLWDAGNLGPLVANGAVLPISPLLRKAGLRESDFIPAALALGRYHGQLYSLPFLVDCEGLFWNRQAFREAGIDEGRPPRNMAELSTFASRLTRRDSSGHITRLGLDLPDFNLVLAIFGGRLVTEDGRPCANDPRNVAALAWYLALARSMGGIEEIESFTSGFGQGQGPNHPFFVGKVAMMLSGEWIPFWIQRYAPHLKYGLAPTPAAAPGGQQGTVLIGGNPMVIPAESRHPAEAWEFLRWTQTAEAQVELAKELNNVPNVRKALDSPALKGPPAWRNDFARFMQFASTPRAKVNPPMPVMNYLLSEIGNARDFVLHGDKTPQQALDDVQRKVLAELSRMEEPGN